MNMPCVREPRHFHQMLSKPVACALSALTASIMLQIAQFAANSVHHAAVQYTEKSITWQHVVWQGRHVPLNTAPPLQAAMHVMLSLLLWGCAPRHVSSTAVCWSAACPVCCRACITVARVELTTPSGRLHRGMGSCTVHDTEVSWHCCRQHCLCWGCCSAVSCCQ